MAGIGKKRYIYLEIGLIFMLGLSSYSAWGVIQPHAMAYFRITPVMGSIPFYLFSIFFTVGSLISGRLQGKLSIRVILPLGCCCTLTGVLLTSLLPSSLFPCICITYGVLMGIGGGISYNAMLANLQNWFPEWIGWITGVLLCMVGISGFLLSALCSALLSLLPFRMAFLALSLYYIAVYLPGLLFMRSAPRRQDDGLGSGAGAGDLGPKEVVRTPHYYLIVLAFLFAVPAYTLISPIFVLVGQERGLSLRVAELGSMLVSVSQTGGRLFFPALSDKLRSNGSLLLDYVLCLVTVLLAVYARGFALLICFILIGFAYGGFMGTFPAVSTKYFGLRCAGVNYALVMIGNSLSGIISPIVAGLLPGAGAKFAAAAVFCALGAACVLGLNVLGRMGRTPGYFAQKTRSTASSARE